MGLFGHLLEGHERERHWSILTDVLRSRRPRHDDGRDGFLPLDQAADVMGVTVAELVEMVGRDWLDAREIGGQPWVRPAVVSVLGVRDTGVAS